VTPQPSELVVRATALYLPITAIIAVCLYRRPNRRQVAGAVLGSAWNLVALLVVNAIAQRVGWWSFPPTTATMLGLPTDLWLGWVLLWGALPALAGGDRMVWVVVALVAADLLLMPLGEPVVRLGSTWLVGELVAVAAALVPGMILARLTIHSAAVRTRAVMQFVTFTGLIFFVLPSVILTVTGEDWSALLGRPRWHFVIAATAIAPAAAMALQALREFAVVGGGTPVPLDPPTRLVTTGPYAYVSNPMQVGGTLLLGCWGVLLDSPAVIAAAAMAAVFSMGVAANSEQHDLSQRFGDAWQHYCSNVRPWIPRWRPHVTEPGVVFVGTTCEPCSEVGQFLAHRSAIQLTIVAAEGAEASLTRVTYRSAAVGTEDGLAALGRSLEHSNLGWAVASWIVRLPLVLPVLQLVTDAVGGGPRRLAQQPVTH
jgi:protein-S-isoprenylcysteine O-methyltransferase Ste14